MKIFKFSFVIIFFVFTLNSKIFISEIINNTREVLVLDYKVDSADLPSNIEVVHDELIKEKGEKVSICNSGLNIRIHPKINAKFKNLHIPICPYTAEKLKQINKKPGHDPNLYWKGNNVYGINLSFNPYINPEFHAGPFAVICQNENRLEQINMNGSVKKFKKKLVKNIIVISDKLIDGEAYTIEINLKSYPVYTRFGAGHYSLKTELIELIIKKDNS